MRLMYLLILLNIPGAKYLNFYDISKVISKLKFRPKKLPGEIDWLRISQDLAKGHGQNLMRWGSGKAQEDWERKCFFWF